MTECSRPPRAKGLIPTAVSLLLIVVGPSNPGAAQAEPVWCHEVDAGDTLSRIARRYATTIDRLQALNAGAALDTLPVGTVLRLPATARLEAGSLELDGGSLPARAGDLRRENRAADRERLSRMRDLAMVRRFVAAGLLVRVPDQERGYWIARVPAALRVARPWTTRFIGQLADAFYALFGDRLKITSLTRTVRGQRALQRWNPNAAPAVGPLRSTHLTGASVDISKNGFGGDEVGWLRVVLRRLERRQLVRATEEFQQPHFHVMVARRYLGYAARLPSALLIGGC